MLTCNSIKDINTHCLEEFKAHADCLENNNHHQFECRKPEMSLNKCVFDKLVRRPIPPYDAAYTVHQPIDRRTNHMILYRA